MPRPFGRAALFFVLRSLDSGSRAPNWPAPERGDMRFRPPGILRPLAHGLLVAILLTLLPAVGDELRPRSPALERGNPAAFRLKHEPGPHAGPAPSTPTGVRDARGRASLQIDAEHRPDWSAPPRYLWRRDAQQPASKIVKQERRAPSYTVSFGAFGDRCQAELVARLVRTKGYQAHITLAPEGLWVHGHRYPTRTSATRIVKILQEIGVPAHVELIQSPPAQRWPGAPPYPPGFTQQPAVCPAPA